jgi:hypothetical protein
MEKKINIFKQKEYYISIILGLLASNFIVVSIEKVMEINYKYFYIICFPLFTGVLTLKFYELLISIKWPKKR